MEYLRYILLKSQKEVIERNEKKPIIGIFKISWSHRLQNQKM